MYIDFAHLSSFQHQDPEFMKNVVQNFNKFEPNLRAGLTKFMMQGEAQNNTLKKAYF